MKIAWCITGADILCAKVFDVFKEIKEKNKDIKVTTFLSRAAGK